MSLLSSIGHALKKITLKGAIKTVEKAATVVVPFAVGGPLGALAGGLIGAAVTPKPSSSDATPPEAYGIPMATAVSGSSGSGGILGAVTGLGHELVEAAKRIGKAESDRIKNATTGAVNAAVQDILNLGSGIKHGSQGAAAAIGSAEVTTPAATMSAIWIVAAIVLLLLFFARGRK